MSDWTELPDYPRTFASQCAPWGSSVRFVNGARAIKNGKPETLSGARAFLQRLEMELIQGRAAARDLSTLLDSVFTAHARHLDCVEWCRVRGDELDVSLRVYATRGSQRLHVSLVGPVGRYADEPLPARAAPARPRPARKPGPSAAPVLPVERLAPPAALLLLRPLTAGARPSYGDPVARDRDGSVHLAVRLPDGDAFARVDPSGAVELAPLPDRDALRRGDDRVMTRAMLPGVHASAAGVLRVDHYETSAGMQERVTLAGRSHTGRSALHSRCWTLGVHGEWFLRCIVHDRKATLLGVHLGSDRRTRVPLPDVDLRGAAVDRRPDGPVLRLLHGPAEEHRRRLHAGPKLELGPAEVHAHGIADAARPVPDGGFVVAGPRALRYLGPGRPPVDLFTLPPAFDAPDYRPWGGLDLVQLGFDADPCWQVDLDFGSDHGPRCRGALVFAADGRVRGLAHTSHDGALDLNGRRVPLADREHTVGISGAPAGDLAVLLSDGESLALAWAPPP